MKILILSVLAFAMIGFMIPDALGKMYVNDGPLEFSINYPHGWIVNEELRDITEVDFTDKHDWTTNLGVYYFEDAGEQLTDREEIDWMVEGNEEQCKNESFNSSKIR